MSEPNGTDAKLDRIAKLEMDCRSYKAMAADAIHRMDAKDARIAELEAYIEQLEETIKNMTAHIRVDLDE